MLNGEYARAEQLLLQRNVARPPHRLWRCTRSWDFFSFDRGQLLEQRQHARSAPRASTRTWSTTPKMVQLLAELGGEAEPRTPTQRRSRRSPTTLWLWSHGAGGEGGGADGEEGDLVSRDPPLPQGRPRAPRRGVSPARGAARATCRRSRGARHVGHVRQGGRLLRASRRRSRAMDAYRKGQAYGRALELRAAVPGREVVERSPDPATTSRQLKKLLTPPGDRALRPLPSPTPRPKRSRRRSSARQWAKAVEGARRGSTTSPRRPRSTTSRSQSTRARPRQAVRETPSERPRRPEPAAGRRRSSTKARKWDEAERPLPSIAVTYMSQADMAMLYITQAHRLESAASFKEAERLYVMVHEPDLAINMYKKNRRYDDMIRLVTSYRKDLLTETHLHLAQQLETEGNFKLAEKHYVEASLDSARTSRDAHASRRAAAGKAGSAAPSTCTAPTSCGHDRRLFGQRHLEGGVRVGGLARRRGGRQAAHQVRPRSSRRSITRPKHAFALAQNSKKEKATRARARGHAGLAPQPLALAPCPRPDPNPARCDPHPATPGP